ncbi:helix-turn-helix domain-containing protein [Nitratidesulfovibrio liaohensis]|uniref:helix-turn-helix domain-containing protein n=1 Tax=Nitratidesulfovibrio liaohensis TaxID=2604158 RepID=UPI0014210D9D|nr:helix-turn-helix transcriptional regulator [Nitratidesulfovibrio liaohensis]NHZ47431.1 helix-turn-helix transcriptional regulator [Nitratidesulfovibrio liaohensis]
MPDHHDSATCFSYGIKALRDNGWQKKQQKDLAKEIGCSASHLAQVFNAKRRPSQDLQDILAKAYGMHSEDIIKIGRYLHEKKGFIPFIGQVEHLTPHSLEQADLIISLTNKQFGIDGQLIGYRPLCRDDFISKKSTIAEFYNSYANELKKLASTIRKL